MPPMRTSSSIALSLLPVLALGCADKTPAKFKYDPPPAAVTNTNYFSLHVSVVNKKGEAIASQSPTYSGGPADVLEVSANGNLRCAKTGEGTLTLSAGGLYEPVPPQCRVPTADTGPAGQHRGSRAAPPTSESRALG